MIGSVFKIFNRSSSEVDDTPSTRGLAQGDPNIKPSDIKYVIGSFTTTGTYICKDSVAIGSKIHVIYIDFTYNRAKYSCRCDIPIFSMTKKTTSDELDQHVVVAKEVMEKTIKISRHEDSVKAGVAHRGGSDHVDSDEYVKKYIIEHLLMKHTFSFTELTRHTIKSTIARVQGEEDLLKKIPKCVLHSDPPSVRQSHIVPLISSVMFERVSLHKFKYFVPL